MKHLAWTTVVARLASGIVWMTLTGTACGGDDATTRERSPVGEADEADDEADDDDELGALDAGNGKADAEAAKPRDASLDAAKPVVRMDGATRDAAGPVDATQTDTSDVARDASLPDAAVGAPVVDASAPPVLTPIETNGQKLPGSARRWTYTEFSDTQCRDGSPAGVAVNLSPSSSKKLMIYLEGGGSCTDEQSCASNPAATTVFVLGLGLVVGTGGVFDRANMANPVRDWNFVYVPYCTGDTHGGGNPDGNVPGVGPQKFVGYLNMRKFLNRIVPTFRDASDVLLTGASAGGFGTSQNAIQVQRAFPNVKIKTINDSGPAMPVNVLPECLQQRSRELWKTDTTFLAECGAACPNFNNYSQDFGVFLARTLSDRPSGLIESAEDAVIRAFFGMGKDNCTGMLDLANPALAGAPFREGLVSYREQLAPYPNLSTFFPPGETHTFIAGGDFYTATAGGMKLVDWFAKIVNGEVPGHKGP